jgi:hypothetical protein
MTGYGLDDWGVGVRVQVVTKIFTLHVVQTGTGVHPASYPMGPWAASSGVKWQGRETDHLPPAGAEFKKMWINIYAP